MIVGTSLAAVFSGVSCTLAALTMTGCAVLSVFAALRRSLVFVATATGLLGGSLLFAALAGSPAPTAVSALATLGALTAAVAGGSAATRTVLERAVRDTEEGPRGGVVASDGRELLRGGQVIGYLERLAVAGLVISGYPEGLAIVVAIKGVGRFSELETSAVRERFIVGTLTSWIWAGACALVVVLIRS